MLSDYRIYIVIAASLFVTTTTRQFEIKPSIFGPPLPHKPFVVVWNVASERCMDRFGVPLNLSDYEIVYNMNKGPNGDSIVIFYESLGYFPHYKNGKPINGGLPQLGDLNAHLAKAKNDIEIMIPDPDFRGLAVIDWESWLPQWVRISGGVFKIYHDMSIKKVQQEHPEWSSDEILAKAKSEYEAAARGFISFTLSLGKAMRPKAKWGFYLYPTCPNNNKTGDKTTLKCSNKTTMLNDGIQWVFDKSTGLYPSVYLGDWFADNHNAVYYVGYRILEAARVDSNRLSSTSAPIYPYHMLTYKKETKYLDLNDLQNSIGVASVLGASGMVIWDGYSVAGTAEECHVLSSYVSNKFGPYVKMISDYALKCSLDHCSGNGRCVLSKFSPDASPQRYHLTIDDVLQIMPKYGNSIYKIFDDHIKGEMHEKSYTTVCQCYIGWIGDDCAKPH